MKDENGNIGIGEWAENTITDIRRFADHWNKKRNLDDRNYPERLSAGDWDEQFLAYGRQDDRLYYVRLFIDAQDDRNDGSPEVAEEYYRRLRAQNPQESRIIDEAWQRVQEARKYDRSK